MGHPGIQTWSLFLCINWLFVGRVSAEPHYMVAIPAVIESGAVTKVCASLLQATENLVMKINLISPERDTILFEKMSSADFNTCFEFQVPSVQRNEIHKFKVKVQGDTFHSEKVIKIMIKVYRPITFIQTDKPIYLPGQTVHFRVVTLDTKFRPANELYNIIEMQDPNQNRIGQWLNSTSNGRILQLSHPLNSEAKVGNYRITVWINGNKIRHDFKVEQYVLPKFDVTIITSDEISVGQEECRVEVCSKYTYGQPVPGSVELEMCRPFSRNVLPPVSRELCYKQTKQTEQNGCVTFTIEISPFTNDNPRTVKDEFHLKVRGEEMGTDISRLQEKTIKLSYVVGKLAFIETSKLYEESIPLEVKVKAVYFNDTPIADRLVYLLEGQRGPIELLQNLTTDSDGIATFLINTTGRQGDIHLKASVTQEQEQTYRIPHYESAELTLSMVRPPSSYSKSVSSLMVNTKESLLPCDKDEDISIQYTIAGEIKGSVDVMFLTLSKGSIVNQGLQRVEVQDGPVTEGKVTFTLKVAPELAPDVQVVAYAVLPSESVIAHSADFNTEKCFSHKVSLGFSLLSAVPGEDTTLHVTAHPNSLCGVSAVDRSVLIKEPGKILDAEKMFNLLPVKKATSTPLDVEDNGSCLNVRQRRYLQQDRDHGRTKDAYKVFKSLGLKMATNLFTRMPPCVNFKGTEYYQYSARKYKTRLQYLSNSFRSSDISTQIKRVRTFFPETWIWDLVEVGESGTKEVSFTVPDTITTWETEAFCLSPLGFGLAPREELTVFQPFFLELSLPYSIIRGEQFELKATVFNYLSKCIMVTVTPAPSLDYTLIPVSVDHYSSCLCANQRKTFSWILVPSFIGAMNVSVSAEALASDMSCDNEIVIVPDRGRVDTVTRSLIVKAEGTEIIKSYNMLLCPQGEALTEEIELHLPDNVIEGSARASLSVLGDILGRAMRNLDGLLTRPYGCGEQNMVRLAPNIYILQYLKNTQQLTPAINEKATSFLTSGYQRQLNYKHIDGAYSTFGRGVGNTWLTAFVLRSFVKARNFVYIDPAMIEESKTWLESKQRSNGCFQQSGKLFHNQMKGGVSDEVTLSAYITAAFLEMNISVSHLVVQISLGCLKESIGNLSNTYATALLAYVFTLAGDMETRAHLLQHLDAVALKQGKSLHWSQTSTETSASLSVEISSYVLLAKLSASSTPEDLGYATRIVNWLIGQQNHYGGFSSTQDTVVALQALALYSTLAFSPDGSSTVVVQSPSRLLTFDVTHDNRLLYQEETQMDVTGKYSLEVKGAACVAMQISLYYNIPTPDNVTTLSVEVKPEADCQSQRPKLTMRIMSLYSGMENSTNMVILDIRMLSGFAPDPTSLDMLKSSGPLVDRVEQRDGHVLLYIRELLKDIPIHHTLKFVQEVQVNNLKPAVVKIYDYYHTSDQAEKEYIFSCDQA